MRFIVSYKLPYGYHLDAVIEADSKEEALVSGQAQFDDGTVWCGAKLKRGSYEVLGNTEAYAHLLLTDFEEQEGAGEWEIFSCGVFPQPGI